MLFHQFHIYIRLLRINSTHKIGTGAGSSWNEGRFFVPLSGEWAQTVPACFISRVGMCDGRRISSFFLIPRYMLLRGNARRAADFKFFLIPRYMLLGWNVRRAADFKFFSNSSVYVAERECAAGGGFQVFSNSSVYVAEMEYATGGGYQVFAISAVFDAEMVCATGNGKTVFQDSQYEAVSKCPHSLINISLETGGF